MKIELPGGLLQVSFIVLKLCHVINWPWKWVLCPTWIPLSIGVGVAGIALLVTVAKEL